MTIALICGGRDYRDRAALELALDTAHWHYKFSHIITGGAQGADTLAHTWALKRGIQTVVCAANWECYGKAAGPMRNAAMAALKPHIVYAFPGGAGTANMVKLAENAGIPVVRLND